MPSQVKLPLAASSPEETISANFSLPMGTAVRKTLDGM